MAGSAKTDGGDIVNAGDIVFLSCRSLDGEKGADKASAFLSADGFNTEDCLGIEQPEEQASQDPGNFLFRIVYPLAYDAQGTMRRLPSSTCSDGSIATLNDRLTEAEGKNKQDLLRQRGAGFPITISQKVQLQHVETGLFLSLAHRRVAERDPECLRVVLRSGSEASYFRVCNSFKIQVAGTPVLKDSDLRFQHCGLDDHFLSMTFDPADPTAEVNLNTRCTSSWRVHRRTKFQFDQDRFLLTSEVISFLHAECERYVTPAFDGSMASSSSGSASSSADADAELDDDAEPTLLRNVLEMSALALGPNAYFTLENEQMLSTGGKVKWGQKYLLRHVSTNLYVAFEGGNATELTLLPRQHAAFVALTRTTAAAAMTEGGNKAESGECSEEDTGNCVQLKDAFTFGCHMQVFPPGAGPGPVAHSLSSFRFLSGPKKGEGGRAVAGLAVEPHVEDTVRLQPVEHGLGLHFAMSMFSSCTKVVIDCLARLLERHVEQKLRSGDGSGGRGSEQLRRSADRKQDRKLVAPCLSMLQRTREWLRKPGGPGMARSTRFVDALMWCSQVPFLLDLDPQGPLPPSLQSLLRETNLTLVAAVQGSAVMQLYVANGAFTPGSCGGILQGSVRGEALSAALALATKGTGWLDGLIRLLGWKEGGSGEVIQAVVQDNGAVLSQHVNEQMLLTLLQLLEDNGPHQPWLAIMHAVTSCSGVAVPQMQEMVLRVFYSAKIFNGTTRPEYLNNRHKCAVETAFNFAADKKEWDFAAPRVTSSMPALFQRITTAAIAGEGAASACKQPTMRLLTPHGRQPQVQPKSYLKPSISKSLTFKRAVVPNETETVGGETEVRADGMHVDKVGVLLHNLMDATVDVIICVGARLSPQTR
jgi:hypothetical protein